MMVSFNVNGLPIPKGSARAFVVKGRAIVTAANAKTRPWEQAIRAEAAIAGCRPSRETISVSMIFRFARPKSHYGARGVRASAPRAHTKKPDLDKLIRTVLDALTGVAYVDDAQVTAITETRKRYASGDEQPGVCVTINESGIGT